MDSYYGDQESGDYSSTTYGDYSGYGQQYDYGTSATSTAYDYGYDYGYDGYASPEPVEEESAYICCTHGSLLENLKYTLEEMSELTGISADECLYALIFHKWNREKTLLELVDNYPEISKTIKTNTWTRSRTFLPALHSNSLSSIIAEYTSPAAVTAATLTSTERTYLTEYKDYLEAFRSILPSITSLINAPATSLPPNTLSSLTPYISTCMVCFDDKPLLLAPCGHGCCPECWVGHTESKISEMGFSLLCVFPGCGSPVPMCMVDVLDAVDYDCRQQPCVDKLSLDTRTNNNDSIVCNPLLSPSSASSSSPVSSPTLPTSPSTSTSTSIDTSLARDGACLAHVFYLKLSRTYASSSLVVRSCGNSQCNEVFIKNDFNSERNSRIKVSNAKAGVSLCPAHPHPLSSSSSSASSPSIPSSASSTAFSPLSPNVNITTSPTPSNTTSTGTGMGTGTGISASVTITYDFSALTHNKPPMSFPPTSLPAMPSAVTCGCGSVFCVQCGEKSNDHRPAYCSDVTVWRAKSNVQKDNSEWLMSHTRKCEKCNVRIEKNEGCNHVTCTNCKHEFCWVCGGDWKEHLSQSNDRAQAYRCIKYTRKSDVKLGNSANDDDKYMFYLARVRACEWDAVGLTSMKHAVERRVAAWYSARQRMQARKAGMGFMHDENKSGVGIPNSNCYLEEARLCALWTKTVLKWSFIRLYGMNEEEHQRPLFEYSMGELEAMVEALCQRLHKEVDDDQESLKMLVVKCSESCSKFISAYAEP